MCREFRNSGDILLISDRSRLPSASDLIQVGLGGRDVGEELADRLTRGVIAAKAAILDLAVQTALADLALATVADVHALDLEAAHAVDVRGLDLDVELRGPLAGGLFPQGLVVGLMSNERRARRTVEPAHGQHLGHFLPLS